MIVEVVEYRPEWAEEFRQETEKLRAVLGRELVETFHIGSTAVPGLSAKPIIDLMPVVRNLSAADEKRSAFEVLGYEYLGEFGIPGRRYMRKGGEHRTHQAHIFAAGDKNNILRHLAVRDYLRAHPKEAAAYGALKIELAGKFPRDIEGYCDGKDEFVKALERRALKWAGEKI